MRLPCVPTDNRDALISLGFERMYPDAAKGYLSHFWMRVVDSRDLGAPGTHRKMVVQRAYLDEARRNA